MGKFVELGIGSESPITDTLRIDQNKRQVSFELTLYRFTDKDTNQLVHYLPTFEMSSYGDTVEEASEMLEASLDDVLGGLLKLSQKHLQVELRKMGWKQVALKNKEYSKAFVDINGELQNFNAVDNKVERLALTA